MNTHRRSSSIFTFSIICIVGFLIGMFMILEFAGKNIGPVTTNPLSSRPAKYDGPLLQSRAGEVEESDGITIRYTHHGEAHGAESTFARNCFKNHGTFKWFKEMGPRNRFVRMCILEDGWVAVQFLTLLADGIYEEVSSYIPHLVDNTVSGIIKWLEACKFTPFNF